MVSKWASYWRGTSSVCSWGCVEVARPQEGRSWARSAGGLRASARLLGAGSHPGACAGRCVQCCVRRPDRSEDAPHTASPASPACCSAWCLCEEPVRAEHNRAHYSTHQHRAGQPPSSFCTQRIINSNVLTPNKNS